MPPAGFEPAIPTSERPQNNTLDGQNQDNKQRRNYALQLMDKSEVKSKKKDKKNRHNHI